MHRLTHIKKHPISQTDRYIYERDRHALTFLLIFSEMHTNTLMHIKKQPLYPFHPPSCCAYSAYLQQIKRGLILRRAILLDLRWAFSLFHSLQIVFGACSLSAQCGWSITGEGWGATAGLEGGIPQINPITHHCPFPLIHIHAHTLKSPALLRNHPDFKVGVHSLIAL